MVRPITIMGTALVGTALATACATVPPAERLYTTQPSSAPFLGDGATVYVTPIGLSPGAASNATSNAAAPLPSSRAIGDAVRRARAPGALGHLFVVRRGDDTLAVEHVDSDGRTLHASLSMRSGQVVEYTVLEREDGTAERMEASITQFGEAEPHERFWANFTGDSILARTARVGRPTVHGGVVAAGELIPFIEPSPAMLEQVVRHARHDASPMSEVPVLVLGDPSVVIVGIVAFQRSDTAVVTLGDMVTRLAVDDQGRLLGGVIPDQGITLDRIDLRPAPSVARRP